MKLAASVSEARRLADALLGRRLVTAQTDAKGRLVRRVLVEQAADIRHEYYLGLVIDRATQRITLIGARQGGVDIEELATAAPERIVREIIDPSVGLLEFQCRKVATALGLSGKLLAQAVRIMKGAYRCLRDRDALQVEINPLAVVGTDHLLALDAKIVFDDNALYRQPRILEMRDLEEEDPKEVEAASHGLNYIALDGDIGCLVNGAGLAMATMDAIVLHGGRPANFLDVGGGASPEKVTNACRIVLRDGSVKTILVNIFAGINRCDWVAQGLVQACRQLAIRAPMVIRLAGTNVEAGRRLLADSGLPFVTAANLDDAAAKAVAAARAAGEPRATTPAEAR